MAKLRSFNPKAYAVMVNGLQASGFADDGAVTVAFEEDFVSKKSGVDGQISASIQHDYSAMATLKLMQTSEFNATMQNLLNVQTIAAKAGQGLVTFPFNILGLASSERFIGAQAWIVKQPDSGIEKEAGTREWSICIAELIANEAGTN